MIALDRMVNLVYYTTYSLASITPLLCKMHKTTNFHFITIAMATKMFFFYIFSFDFIRAGLDGHFGVLHAPVYHLGNTKRPKKQQKWLKISVFW